MFHPTWPETAPGAQRMFPSKSICALMLQRTLFEGSGVLIPLKEFSFHRFLHQGRTYLIQYLRINTPYHRVGRDSD